MPAGCDFVCKNEDCECFDTGFTITAPWPMGGIDEILASKKVTEIPELKENIQNLKNSGREYMCITFPNKDDISTKCYRVNLWDEGNKRILQFDVIKGEGQEMIEALGNANLPKTDPQTGTKLKTFVESIADGIDCPYCKKSMNQDKWFAKEI